MAQAESSEAQCTAQSPRGASGTAWELWRESRAPGKGGASFREKSEPPRDWHGMERT